MNNNVSNSVLVILVLIVIYLYVSLYKEDKKRIDMLKKIDDMLEDGHIDENEKLELKVMADSIRKDKKHGLSKKMKTSAINGFASGLLHGILTWNPGVAVLSCVSQGCVSSMSAYIEGVS